jgi:hypothetical protein
MKKLLLSLLVPLIFLANSLQAWNANGHKLVAQIAYDHLNPNAKKQVNTLVKTFESFYPKHNRFIEAATWADDVRGIELSIFDSWHYTNLPFDPEGILTQEDLKHIADVNKGNDAVWILSKAIDTLSKKDSTPFAKALMLNLLLHIIADIHQPFHCCSRYSKEHPQGDQGANLFKIKTACAQNLHEFWDKGAGLFSTQKLKIKPLAASLAKRYPHTEFSTLKVKDISAWSLEGRQIAEAFGYQLTEHKEPSSEYVAEAQKIASERVTLAGYRLANVLNTLFSAEENETR